jgi:peptidoglycan/LPS O-acetylase OafA/YrhL
LVALVPLLFWCDHDSAFLHWGGTVLEWDIALFFVAVALGGRSAFVTRVAGNRPAVILGRASLPIYIWHYPVFMFVHRHTTGWSWQAAAAVGLLGTVAICVATDRLLDRRVTAFLRRPGWRDLDHGVPAWVATRARPAVTQLRTPVDREDAGTR